MGGSAAAGLGASQDTLSEPEVALTELPALDEELAGELAAELDEELAGQTDGEMDVKMEGEPGEEMTSGEARLAALLDAESGPEDELLAQLLRQAPQDALLALQEEAAVPVSPQPSPESPSLPPSPDDDLVKVKDELDDWPAFPDEPLAAQFNQFEDQFLLFPQLSL